jgi:hypothetical protein
LDRSGASQVFNSGVDFTIANQPPGITVITGCIVDDLQQLMDRLQLTGAGFDGPFLTLPGMLSTMLREPDGSRIGINQVASASPG